MVLLRGGGALFVWQSGPVGSQDIHARFMGADNTFSTSEILVNTYTTGQQCDPVAATLADGSVVVAWSSHEQDGSMQGIYGQRFSAPGQRLGGEFQVAEATQWNQRNPALAPLANGGYVAVWVNETGSDVTGEFQVGIQGRLFDASGPQGHEFRVNASTNICSSPAVAAMASGGFMVAWADRGDSLSGNGLDVYSRAFDNAGTPRNYGPRVNAEQHGDQFAPRLAGGESECLLVWASMGQDGSFEGVYGRFLSEQGVIYSDEFRVNANPAGRQIQPVVASDGGGQFLAVWSSFVGGSGSFDLFAQRFQVDARPIPTPSAPYLNALSSSEILVSWAEQTGIDLQSYDLYIDGATEPVRVTSNSHRLTGLAPSSTHTVKLGYRFNDGRTSPLSVLASKITFGGDANQDGLPDDWQQLNWGKPVNWPAASADSDGDGASNLQEFLAGTDPTDPASALKLRIERAGSQQFLHWNSVPGVFYQVQKGTEAVGAWNDVGTARFANGSTDSISVEGPENEAFYRIIRLR